MDTQRNKSSRYLNELGNFARFLNMAAAHVHLYVRECLYMAGRPDVLLNAIFCVRAVQEQSSQPPNTSGGRFDGPVVF